LIIFCEKNLPITYFAHFVTIKKEFGLIFWKNQYFPFYLRRFPKKGQLPTDRKRYSMLAADLFKKKPEAVIYQITSAEWPRFQ
jgi:hypothetical protein